jgi:urease
MGDPNGSIPTVQPCYAKPMWGSKAGSAALNSVAFVSQVSITSGTIASYNLSKRTEAVRNCRSVTKKDLKWNDATPKMTVDAESYEVRADGVLQDVQPASKVALAREYNLF